MCSIMLSMQLNEVTYVIITTIMMMTYVTSLSCTDSIRMYSLYYFLHVIVLLLLVIGACRSSFEDNTEETVMMMILS